MTRHCFALDLIDDPELIAEYEQMHTKVWPEIIASIKQSGIQEMQIYRVRNRLFMVIEVNEEFNIAEKAAADRDNEIVMRWESLMWKYQQALPLSAPGEKWQLMKKIFDLSAA